MTDGGREDPIAEMRCDTSPLEDERVVDESCGVFVAPMPLGGLDTSPGTRKQPVATLSAAFAAAKAAGHPWVFACAETYDERLELDASSAGVGLFGGLTCPGSAKPFAKTSEAKAIVQPTTTAAHEGAVSISNIALDVRLHAIEIVSPDATVPSESSIGLLLRDVKAVELRESVVRAGKGKDGAQGAEGAFGEMEDPELGAAARGAYGGRNWARRCLVGKTDDGGSGGNAFEPDASATDISSSNHGANGRAPLGGKGSTVEECRGRTAEECRGRPEEENCQPLAPKHGEDGKPGRPGHAGDGASRFGTLLDGAWLPSKGSAGTAGTPGGSGGGGAGGPLGLDMQGNYIGGGGAGGVGSCGGGGGEGGEGGGASIAILAWMSSVHVTRSLLQTSSPGAGGAGGPGRVALSFDRFDQHGQPVKYGRFGGLGSGTGCHGGKGGVGGTGGDGGGGAGGLSVGILTDRAEEVSIDDASVKAVKLAPAGRGGTAPNRGIDGRQHLTFQPR